MAYISETQQAILKVNVGRIKEDSTLIRGVILRDKSSEAKSEMRNGVNYYDGKHDILSRDFRVYHVKKTKRINENKANNRVPNTFHTELNDQKADYILAKEVAITSKNEDLDKEFSKGEFREKFEKTLHEMCVNCSNKGIEWLHFYIDENGKFDYTIIPAEQIIPDYDESSNELISILRYYLVDYINDKGELKQKTRVEVWDDKEITYFIETEKGDFIKDTSIDPNPRPHWIEKRVTKKEVISVTNKSWNAVPFIPLPNNSKKFTDLKRIKALIDLYDLVISGFGNDVEDMSEIIIKVKNYQGTDNEEMAQMIRETRIIKVSGDGDAEALTITIPVEAKNTLLKMLKENIYIFGRGVDYSGISLNNPTNLTLKFMFARLDLKANALITNLKTFIKSFLYYYSVYLGKERLFDASYIEITFNKSIIINEQEVIQNVVASQGLLSEETLLANHPWVKDVQVELDRKKEEKENIVDLTKIPAM